jgi:hypothetical protein
MTIMKPRGDEANEATLLLDSRVVAWEDGVN